MSSKNRSEIPSPSSSNPIAAYGPQLRNVISIILLPDCITRSTSSVQIVEAEVSRLEELKSTKMKESVSRKKKELKELRRCFHLLVDTDSEMEESGVADPQIVLERIEAQISKVKEESFSRTEIVNKADKWLSACKEESRLEKYNRGEIVYTSTKGPDYVLRRVERARAIVSKIPAMVETLTSEIIAWEKENGIEFKYDGLRLLSMLENYAISKKEKEQEGKRKMKSQGPVKTEGVAFLGDEQSHLEKAMQRPNIYIEENGKNPDSLFCTEPVHSAKTADDLYMLSHGTIGYSNSENARSECRKSEQEIPQAIPNANNTSWVFVCEKEAKEKHVTLAASNCNNDKSPRKVMSQPPNTLHLQKRQKSWLGDALKFLKSRWASKLRSFFANC